MQSTHVRFSFQAPSKHGIKLFRKVKASQNWPLWAEIWQEHGANKGDDTKDNRKLLSTAQEDRYNKTTSEII